jgi:lipoyl(octanoyl) transferase
MSDVAWRLLLDPPAAGAWNMAVDEVLLDGVDAGSAPPTLRFYTWTPACLSLGYFQPFNVLNVEGCREHGIDIVRRPTGGRAILHDRELTYSVALPASVLGHDAGILPSYRRLSLALQAGLQRLGIDVSLGPESEAPNRAVHGPVCFDRPSAHEILLHGRKLVGSAQVRRAGALLQHGSIVIEPRMATLVACLRLDDDPKTVAGRLDGGVAGLAEAGVFEPAAIADAIAEAVASAFDVLLAPGRLTEGESGAAGLLARSKYQSPEWNRRPLETGQKTTRTR